jgi:hypothetical protein
MSPLKSAAAGRTDEKPINTNPFGEEPPKRAVSTHYGTIGVSLLKGKFLLFFLRCTQGSATNRQCDQPR